MPKIKMENQTNLTDNSTTSLTAEQIALNVSNANRVRVAQVIALLETEALNMRVYETPKALRIANSFTGKFVANLANNISKAESTAAKKVSAFGILDDFRNPANYVENIPSALLLGRLTENRLKYYKRTIGKTYGCEFTDGDIFSIVAKISAKIFLAKK